MLWDNIMARKRRCLLKMRAGYLDNILFCLRWISTDVFLAMNVNARKF